MVKRTPYFITYIVVCIAYTYRKPQACGVFYNSGFIINYASSSCKHESTLHCLHALITQVLHHTCASKLLTNLNACVYILYLSCKCSQHENSSWACLGRAQRKPHMCMRTCAVQFRGAQYLCDVESHMH